MKVGAPRAKNLEFSSVVTSRPQESCIYASPFVLLFISLSTMVIPFTEMVVSVRDDAVSPCDVIAFGRQLRECRLDSSKKCGPSGVPLTEIVPNRTIVASGVAGSASLLSQRYSAKTGWGRKIGGSRPLTARMYRTR